MQLNSWLWIAWAIYWLIAARNVQRTQVSEGAFVRLQHLVPLFLGFTLIFGRPGLSSELAGWVGVVITAIGLSFSVWGRIHLGRYWSGIITLKEGHRLIRTGPYRLVRHPLYTGFLTGALGSAITAGTAAASIGFLIMVGAYLIKIRREEALLSQQFGDEYQRFKQEVRALVPFVY